MKYVWDNVDTLSKHTGGGKARQDTSFFLKRKGYLSLHYYNSKNIFLKALYRLLNFLLFPFLIKSESELFIQYPFNGGQRFILRTFKSIKKLKCTFLIHDLESIRLRESTVIEKNDLSLADSIIALNEPMSEYIQNILCVRNTKISQLKLWDYHLVPSKDKIQYFDLTGKVNESIKVLITGNLNSKKAEYLEKLYLITNVHFYLLGQSDMDYSNMQNVTYLGCFDSSSAIELICDDPLYGLVWDGNSVDSCEGLYGNYLEYNLPHKTSFYLSNKLQIIVWESAYVSQILDEYNVSYKIKSLHDICNVVDGGKSFNLNLYEKISNGYFLIEALKDINK